MKKQEIQFRREIKILEVFKDIKRVCDCYEPPFIYRKDPIPGVGVCHWNYYRSVKKNKNYVAKLLGYKNLFPGDARISKSDFFRFYYADDFTSNKGGKSWKKTKKKKQWMQR